MGDRCGLTDALSPARPQEKRHARLAEAGNTAHELMAISVDAHRMSAMVKMRERTKSAETAKKSAIATVDAMTWRALGTRTPVFAVRGEVAHPLIKCGDRSPATNTGPGIGKNPTFREGTEP